MASNNRSSGTAAFRYASALVDLAAQNGAIQQIEQDIADLKAMIAASDDLKSLIRSPLASAGAQQSALASVADAAHFHALTKNFLLVLAQNRRLPQMESVIKAVEDNLSARRGEVRATIESASELSPEQKRAFEQTLSAKVGQPVTVDARVNKDLIGGVTVTLGSLLIDDSVRTKLDRLGRAMKYSGAKAA